MNNKATTEELSHKLSTGIREKRSMHGNKSADTSKNRIPAVNWPITLGSTEIVVILEVLNFGVSVKPISSN